MHKIFKRFLASALLACFSLVFAACGGGGGGNVEMTTISGVAMKGPIKGTLVQVFKLNSNGTKGELLGSGISDNSAVYGINIPKAKAVPPLLVTVSGRSGAFYTSETTGLEVPFTSAETFNAVLTDFDSAKQYTVSPLTDAAFQQLQQFLTENPTSIVDVRVASAANARIGTLFNVSDILADPASDPAYAAALKIIDQMVETSGTGTTLQTMTLINQAIVDVGSQAYQGYLTALNAAAAAVIANANDPAVTSAVNAIIATATNPPVAPVLTDTTAPNAVLNIKAVAGAETATTGFVTLTWNAAVTTGSNPVAGYDVYRDGIKLVTIKATGYVDAPLALSTAYAYYVIAFDAAANRSLPSTVVNATTPAAPYLNVVVDGQLSSGISLLPKQDIFAPMAPSNLTASTTSISATNSSVLLAWSPSSDDTAVTGYEIYRNGSKIATVTLLGYTDPSVTSGTPYIYYTTALDAAGNRSVASNQLVVTPNQASLGVTVNGELSTGVIGLPQTDITAPTAPATLTASTSAISATNSSVLLAWSASSDDTAVTGYEVYRDGSKIATVSLLGYSDPSVTSNVTYTYYIKAFDAAGNISVAGTQLSVTPNQASLGVTFSGQLSSSIIGF